MAEKVLVDFIRRNLSRGAPLEQVTKKLSEEGWPQGEIEEALDEVEAQLKTSRKASGKMWLIIIVVTITLGVMIMILSSFLFFGESFMSFGEGLNASDIKACEDKGEGVYRMLCYSDLSKSNDDVGICNNLQNTEERKFRDICIRDYAVWKMDIDTCSEIENEPTKNQCIEWIKNKAAA